MELLYSLWTVTRWLIWEVVSNRVYWKMPVREWNMKLSVTWVNSIALILIYLLLANRSMSFMDINVMELFRLCRKDLTQDCREKMLCRENSNMSIRMMGTGHKVLWMKTINVLSVILILILRQVWIFLSVGRNWMRVFSWMVCLEMMCWTPRLLVIRIMLHSVGHLTTRLTNIPVCVTDVRLAFLTIG